MAKTLVQYIRCDRRVLNIVKGEFDGTKLTLRRIADLRASWQRPYRDEVGHWREYDAIPSSFPELEKANKAYVAALLKAGGHDRRGSALV